MDGRTIAAAIAVGVLSVLLAWNTWTLTTLNARVSALELGMQRTTGLVADMELLLAQRAVMRAEPELAEVESTRPRPAPRRGKKARPELSAEDRDDRYERIATQWVAGLELEVEAFADEQGLSSAETDELLQELELLYETLGAVRQDVVEGEMTLADAKVELKVTKEDSDRRLRELLGDDRHAALQARLRDR
jgi:hypothetical protein